MFWIGEGVFTIDGKDYKFGDKLPNLPAETLKSLKAKGLASDTAPQTGAPVVAENSDEVLELRAKVAGLTTELATAKAEVEALSKQLTDPAAPALALVPGNEQKGAGPKR